MPNTLTPNQIGSSVSALVDLMIPGDETFPPASQVGTHLWLMDNIRTNYSPETIHELIQSLNAGGDFSALTVDEQAEALRQFEQESPELFGFVRAAIYFGYYQTPPVVEAVRALGRAYNHAPQPDGYELAPFDPATLPEQPRGSYIKTEDVRRVDLSAIDLAGLEQSGFLPSQE